jgi:restriction endonuclease Mrr
MALPTSSELRMQVLKLLQDQNSHNLSEVKDSIARKLDVSESERKKMSIKKGRPIYDSRIIHTLSVLRKQDLLTNERRGVFKITRSGFSEAKKF